MRAPPELLFLALCFCTRFQDALGGIDCPMQSSKLGPGCKCSLRASCDAGLYCTRRYNSIMHELSGRSGIEAVLYLDGYCMPCMQGDYCPAGTTMLPNPEQEARELTSMEEALQSMGLEPPADPITSVLEGVVQKWTAAEGIQAIEGLLPSANITDTASAMRAVGPALGMGMALAQNAGLVQIGARLREIAGADQRVARLLAAFGMGMALAQNAGLVHNPTRLREIAGADQRVARLLAAFGVDERAMGFVQPLLEAVWQEENRFESTRQLMCPEGFYCPTPREIRNCSLGDFCPVVSILKISDEPLLEAIQTGGQLIEGNFCPKGSVDPSIKCRAGSYCPSPDEEVLCPQGSYCPTGSASPIKCPWLSTCPKGASDAPSSWGGFLVGMLIVVVMIGCIVLSHRYTRMRSKENEVFAEKQERFSELMAMAGLPPPELRAFEEIEVKVSVTFNDLKLKLKDGTTILNGVTGSFPHSQLVAIMGGSGCGKSTLMNVLLGKDSYGIRGGQVLINGRKASTQLLKSIKGFVPQDDTIHEDLTVRENLEYSAEMRLPGSFTHAKRKQVVHTTCQLLQLVPVMNSLVGSVKKRGISGGQRKRVNIGVELVAQPSLLYLDEPTSGLDSTAALTVLTGLKHLCQRGLSSIMVIHQPRQSIFALFDQLLLLGDGGNLVFVGAANMALQYFAHKGFSLPRNENPSDFLLDVTMGNVECEHDPDFEVKDLFHWWKDGGPRWLSLASSSVMPNVGGWVPSSYLPRFKQGLLQQFREIDSDGDGFITEEEVRKFVVAMGYSCSKEAARMMVEVMNDGKGIPMVSCSDFVKYGSRGVGAIAGLPPSRGSHAQLSGMAEMQPSAAMYQNAAPILTKGRHGALNIAPGFTPGSPSSDPGLSCGSSPSPSFEVSVAKPEQLPKPRQMRSPIAQTFYIFLRSAKKCCRGSNAVVLDTSIIIVVAGAVGALQGTDWAPEAVGPNFLLYSIALGIAVTTSTLRVFGCDQVVRWREVASGYNVLSVFMGSSVFDLLPMTLRPLVFSAIYWSLTATDIPFMRFFVLSWMYSWWCSGLSYIISVMIPSDSALLAGACVPLIFGGFLSGYSPSLMSFGRMSPMYLLTYIAYGRWGLEALMVGYFNHPDIRFRLTALAIMKRIGYCGFKLEDESGLSGGTLNALSIAAALNTNPHFQTVFRKGMEMMFPSVYAGGGKNSTEIIQSFAQECEAIEMRGEDTTICNEIEEAYNSAVGYKRCTDSASAGVAILFIQGLVLRLLAFVALKYTNRAKQM